MPALCEVCASEPFKYRCPTCGTMSCSLACTRTHKIYCAPKAPSAETTTSLTDSIPQFDETNTLIAGETGQKAQNGNRFTTREPSSEIKDLLKQYPMLNDQLRDIYKATLQEQWVEGPVHGDRPRYHGRGKPPQRNRGPWTREKGFNRGLGKVRKYRGRCEDGLEIGKGADAFMRLLTLANEGSDPQEPQ
ncbi:HIT finger domain protein [Aspergillus pseudoustus]|uniref:HIT finger domain protein n=1 Tax=Aspergillus pseudoustus TaxID=1810923 RepID=A0ABR4JQZ8_9EURO